MAAIHTDVDLRKKPLSLASLDSFKDLTIHLYNLIQNRKKIFSSSLFQVLLVKPLSLC